MSFDSLNTDLKIKAADESRRRGQNTAFAGAQPPQFFNAPSTNRAGQKMEKREHRKHELLTALTSIEESIQRINNFLKKTDPFTVREEDLEFFSYLVTTLRSNIKSFTKRDAAAYKEMGFFELLQEYLSSSVFMLEEHMGKSHKNMRRIKAGQTIGIIKRRSEALKEGKMKKDNSLLTEDVDDLFSAGLLINNFPSLWRVALPDGLTTKKGYVRDFKYVKESSDIFVAQYDKTIAVLRKFKGKQLWQLTMEEQEQVFLATSTLKKFCDRPLAFIEESIKQCKKQNPHKPNKKNEPLQRLIAVYEAFAAVKEVCGDLPKRVTRMKEHVSVLRRSENAAKEGVALLERAEKTYPLLRNSLIDTTRHLAHVRTRITAFAGGSPRMITDDQEAVANKYVATVEAAAQMLHGAHEVWHAELSVEIVNKKKGKKKAKKS